MLEAGGDALRWMTSAPELPGSLALVEALRRHGVVASIGQSDASYAEATAAVAVGARAATHVFNAMRPLHHRAPGILGAVLELPEVSCEVIVDGHHVDGAVLRLALRCLGIERTRLVTDAIAAAGMPDGRYALGRATVAVSGGVARTASGGLAGSTLTMDGAVRGAVRLLGVSVEAAVRMASANPARLLGLAGRAGAVAPGYVADLVVLDDDLRVEATMVAGHWVHRRAAGWAGREPRPAGGAGGDQ